MIDDKYTISVRHYGLSCFNPHFYNVKMLQSWYHIMLQYSNVSKPKDVDMCV